MALLKNVVDARGITTTYHRINGCTLRYNLDHSVTATVILASYIDQAARTADKLPVRQTTCKLSVAIRSPASIDQAFLYDQLRILPGWADAASDVANIGV